MRLSLPPVLEVLPSVRRWERIRVPLAIGVVVILLIAVVALVYRAIRQSQLADDLTEARSALAEGTVTSWARFDALLGQHDGLASDEQKVAALAALGAAERSFLLGTPEAAAARAAAAQVAAAPEEAAAGAQAWAELLAGRPDPARLTAAARAYPASGPIRHAHALALWQSGSSREALAEIAAVRQAEPGYKLAAFTQAELLRQSGQLEAARQVLAQLPPAQYPERGLVEAACALDEAESKGQAPPDVAALVGPAQATRAPRLVARAKLALGRQKLLAGSARDATTLLREAVSLDAHDAEAAVQLARALVRSGDAQGALAAIDALGPASNGQALVERTLALALLHRTRDAEASLGRIAAADLPAERGALLRYMIAWQKLELRQAEHEISQASATDPADALVRRAEVLLSLGKRNPAVKALRASRSGCARAYGLWVEGDWEATTAGFDAARAEEPACVARVLGRTGLGFRAPAEMVRDLEVTLSRWPDAEDRILLGRARFRAGQDGAAEIARVIEGGADSLLALTMAAEAYAEMGKKAEGLAVIAKAKTLYPRDARPLATEIRVVRMAGDNDEAMRLSEAALTAYPDQPDLVRERSITLVEAGRIAESERVSDIAYVAGPHFVEFARARIRAVEAAKGFPPADQQMVRALRFCAFLPYSEEVKVRSMIALLHARRGGRRELDTAEAFLRPLVRLDAHSSDFNLAMAAVDRGYQRVVQLGAHLRRALTLEPLTPDAYKWLQEAEVLEPDLRAQYERLYPGRPL